MAKSKIAQFKKIGDEKIIIEIKNNHSQQTVQLNIEFKEELDSYNEEWDNEFSSLNQKYEKMREEITSYNKNDLDSKMSRFESVYPKAQKCSKELLHLHSVLDNQVKLKEYD